MAAGLQQSSDFSSRTALIEHWDGTRWSIVPSPTIAGAPFVSLTSIAATSSTDVWVAGSAPVVSGNGAAAHRALGRHRLDARHRAAQPAPRLLRAVRADRGGRRRRLAAGYATNGGSDTPAVTTLIEHWDGTNLVDRAEPRQLHRPEQPTVGADRHRTERRLAVGNSDDGSQFVTASTLTEHWNGTRWALVPSPNTAETSNYLATVVAATATNVWALGVATSTRAGQLPLLQQWNGTQWSQRPYHG